MSLVVADLCVSRGGVPLLEGVGFALAAGHALILRGPNGIGKTTLLRCVAGLQPPTSGRIEVGEEIAYASHADGVKSVLSVRENLDFWAGVHGTGRTGAAMAAMDLSGLADRPAGELSAGQKRRLGLARLSVTGRPVWLLDEPTVSLDAGSVTLFADVLRAHLGQGGSALIASHVDVGLPEARWLDLLPFRAGVRSRHGIHRGERASDGFADAGDLG